MSIIEETLHRLGEQEASQVDAKVIAARAIPMGRRRPVRSLSRMLLIGGGVIVAISAVVWLLPGMIGASPSGAVNVAAGQPEKTATAPISGSAAVKPEAVPPAVPTPAVDEPVQKEQPAARPDPAPVSAPAAEVADSKLPQAASSPAKVAAADGGPWLAEGRAAMLKGDSERAMHVWDEGLNGLGTRQMVVAVAAYRELAPAVVAWRKLSNYPDAMIIPGVYRQQPAYRVVLLSSPVRNQREQDLVQARTAIGVSGGAITTLGRLGRVSPEVKVAPQPSFDPLGKGLLPEPKVAVPPSDFVFEGQAEPALQALNRGDYRAAITLLKPLAEQYPRRSEPMLWLAKAELALGKSGDAATHLAQVVDMAPGSGEAWLLRGIVAQEGGDHAQALKWFGEALRLQPNNPDVHFNIGYSQQALGRLGEAESAWRRFQDLARDLPRYAKQRAYVERHRAAPQP